MTDDDTKRRRWLNGVVEIPRWQFVPYMAWIAGTFAPTPTIGGVIVLVGIATFIYGFANRKADR